MRGAGSALTKANLERTRKIVRKQLNTPYDNSTTLAIFNLTTKKTDKLMKSAMKNDKRRRKTEITEKQLRDTNALVTPKNWKPKYYLHGIGDDVLEYRLGVLRKINKTKRKTK